MNIRQAVALIYLISLISGISRAEDKDTLVLRSGLCLRLAGIYSGAPITPNPVAADLALGKWKAPSEGEKVRFAGGEERKWAKIVSDSAGWFSDSSLTGCYVHFSVKMDKKTVMILEAMGNEMAIVNGIPRPGNPYGLKDYWETWEPNFQYSLLPVMLNEGTNDLIFLCRRGRLKVSLYPPPTPVMFNRRDLTIPDLIAGENADTWGSIAVVNATDKPVNGLTIRSVFANGENSTMDVPAISPLSVRKISFILKNKSVTEKGKIPVTLTLFPGNDTGVRPLDTATIPLKVVAYEDNHKETFISALDGSVQYYGINPASGRKRDEPSALFLSLHGAAVEAVNQSGSYYPKNWGHIVAPTNRRPYGFNWEDWGRADALEAMEIVKARYNIDEERVYLTGHSMGGHGAWHLGAMFPDKFAAIGPSAGWITYWSYRFREEKLEDTAEMQKIVRRSTTPSETFMHAENYKQHGVYILHGSEDDNVGPEQARMMVERLRGIHDDFIYHEQKGAGHWWDVSDEPGADCVDWTPMFDFFARHSRPGKTMVRRVEFKTSNPGISAKNNWLTIHSQIEQLTMSSADIMYDPGKNRFSGKTENIRLLGIDADILRGKDSLFFELDGQKFSTKPSRRRDKIWLENQNGGWKISSEPSLREKGPHRYGTFKDAFRNRMVLVYGTKGTDEENEWAYGKARFDAEKLWYQGNVSADVVADVDFDDDRERNVIIYGNKNTNTAWRRLLSGSPVQVGTSYAEIGDKMFSGDSLAAFFVYPKKGNPNSLIGVVAGSGISGMRTADHINYLNPGIGLPDCTLLSVDVLKNGYQGVLAAGFFGYDWSLNNGEFVWKQGQ